MGSELELRLCQNLTNLAKFQLREKRSDLPRTGDGFLKKNQNAPRPSEHPPVRGKKCQNV